MRRAWIAPLLGVLLSPLALADDAKPAPSRVFTTGSATVTVPADNARVTIAVSAKAQKANDAAAKLGSVMNSVREALVGLGHSRGSLASTGYSLSTLDDLLGQTARGYSASSSLSADLSDLSQLASLIDAVLAAGPTKVAEIAYLPKDPEGARARALAAALEQARRDAEVLAVAAGGRLGRLLSLSTDRASGPSMETSSFSATLGSSYILAPEISISVTVRGEWEVDLAEKLRRAP